MRELELTVLPEPELELDLSCAASAGTLSRDEEELVRDIVEKELADRLAGKQDTLSGTEGQLVGFDAGGRATAISAEYVTEREMDAAITEAVAGAMEAAY